MPPEFIEKPVKNEERYLVIDQEEVVVYAVRHQPHVIVDMGMVSLSPLEEELDDEAPVTREHVRGVQANIAAVALESSFDTVVNCILMAHIAQPLQEATAESVLVNFHVAGALVAMVIGADGDHPGFEQATIRLLYRELHQVVDLHRDGGKQS